MDVILMLHKHKHKHKHITPSPFIPSPDLKGANSPTHLSQIQHPNPTPFLPSEQILNGTHQITSKSPSQQSSKIKQTLTLLSTSSIPARKINEYMIFLLLLSLLYTAG
jgi:hypothetical protein